MMFLYGILTFVHYWSSTFVTFSEAGMIFCQSGSWSKTQFYVLLVLVGTGLVHIVDLLKYQAVK